MNGKRDKFLIKAMGRCWKTQKYYCGRIFVGRKKCSYFEIECDKPCCTAPYKKMCCDVTNQSVINMRFSTWQGFGKLWEWAVKQEFFPSFYFSTYLLDEKNLKTDFVGEIIANIITDIVNPDRFADAIYKFLKEEKNEG